MDAIAISEAGSERRAAAPHPGPIVRREYVEALGISIDEFARAIGVDAGRLDGVLAGRASFEVDCAIRVGRALQLSPERLMHMQVRHDFAAARDVRALREAGVLEAGRASVFPERFVSGRLGRTFDGSDGSLFFWEDGSTRAADEYPGFHALWRNDRLRVFGPEAQVLWVGPVLHDFDGGMLLPYVRAATWRGWFASALRADLAFSTEHAAYVDRMLRT